MWQDLKRAARTWRIPRFISLYSWRNWRCNKNILLFVFAFSPARSCGSTISIHSFRKLRTSSLINMNISVSTSMGEPHMDEVYAAFLQRALIYSPSRGESEDHWKCLCFDLFFNFHYKKYIISITNLISDLKWSRILNISYFLIMLLCLTFVLLCSFCLFPDLN